MPPLPHHHDDACRNPLDDRHRRCRPRRPANPNLRLQHGVLDHEIWFELLAAELAITYHEVAQGLVATNRKRWGNDCMERTLRVIGADIQRVNIVRGWNQAGFNADEDVAHPTADVTDLDEWDAGYIAQEIYNDILEQVTADAMGIEEAA